MPLSREAAPGVPTPDTTATDTTALDTTALDTTAPDPPEPDPPGRDQLVLRVREPGELVSTVPLVMGFHPRDSLVVISGGSATSRRLGLTVRVDLPLPEHEVPMAESVVRSVLSDKRSGAAVIVIGTGTSISGGAGAGTDPPRRELAALVKAELEGHGIEVHTVIWAEGTTAGSRWECYDGCCRGVLPDPSGLPLAASAVLSGQVVYADRAELEQVVEPVDPQGIRRREIRLIELIDQASDDGNALADIEAGDAVVGQAIADAAAGRLVLDDEAVVELAVALTSPEVRDAAIRHSTGPDAAAAEQLWAALTRETPDPEAAEPAALLAVSALMRGDGALANVALDRAERAWPGHRLSRLLRAIGQAGVHPTDLRNTLMLPVPVPVPSMPAAKPAGTRPQPMSRARTRRRRKTGNGSR